jgi:small subunit ribosomal protein S4e
MTHMKRAVMPTFWPVRRKGAKYAMVPDSGPHPFRACLPLRTLVRDVLRYAETAAEADKIIRQGAISVDGKQRKEPGFPVGLMDALEIGAAGCFRLLPDLGGFSLVKITKAEAGKKPCRITGKRTLKGGTFQLSLHDGRSLLVKGGSHRPGDTLALEVPKQKVTEHTRFKEGENAIVIDGNNRGAVGKISNIRERKTMTEKASVVLDVGGKNVTTLREYVMVGSFPVPPRFARMMAEKAKEERLKPAEKPKERPGVEGEAKKRVKAAEKKDKETKPKAVPVKKTAHAKPKGVAKKTKAGTEKPKAKGKEAGGK